MKESYKPLELFISYSHKDDRWRSRLDSHLALLKRQKVFDVWHDRRIGAGREWAGEINEALERASVVLLLVSADFIASDYCYDKEMRRALQRHDQGTARVVPVILRDCDWHSADFGRLQAVPRDGRPIARHASLDAAMRAVTQALRTIAEELRGDAPSSSQSYLEDSKSLPTVALPVVHNSPQDNYADKISLGEVPSKPTPPKQSNDNPERPPHSKLWIGSNKLEFLKLALFEFDWPPQIRGGRLLAWLLASISIVTVAAAVPYFFILKPRIDEARDLMRRADYADAVTTIKNLPQWAELIPIVTSLAAQASFGARLSRGEDIRELAPELDALNNRYPDAPTVLVFMGLKSYYDANMKLATKHFTDAAAMDPAHVEAHFLAAGRQIESAYVALGKRDETSAKVAADEARRLIDVITARSPLVSTLPRYGNEIAEFYELGGDSQKAYEAYAKLASLQALSALQSAMVSWRLPEGVPAHRDGAEAIEAAILRTEKASVESGAVEGWSFRVSPTEAVDVHTVVEKLCMLDWANEISKSLLSSLDSVIAKESRSVENRGFTAGAAQCGNNAIGKRIREIICVQVVTALDRLPPADAGRSILEVWKGVRLDCAAGLRPLPVLPAPSVPEKPPALHT